RGIEGEAAVAVAAGGAGLGGEAGLALVDIGDGQRPTGRQVAGNHTAIVGERALRAAGQHRCGVGAVDSNGGELVGGAVVVRLGEAVGVALAGVRLPASSPLVPYTVLFRSRGIEGEAAVAVAAGGAGLGGEARLALVDIGDGQRATGRQVAGNHPDILGDRAGGDAAEHRGVVGAVDGDRAEERRVGDECSGRGAWGY